MIPYVVFETIQLGPVTIYVWGLLVAVGFLAGTTLAYHEAKRRGLPATAILDLALLVFVGAVVGARLFYVVGHLPYYLEHPWEIVLVYEGGLAFFGGLSGALLAALLFIRRRKLPLWRVADTVAPAVALGYLFGRAGCFAIHDHLGSVTTVLWGINVNGVIRHETSLYEMVANGLLPFLVMWLLRKRIKNEGLAALGYLAWFSVVRFVTDFFRASDLPVSDIRIFGLTGAQYLAVLLFTVALFLVMQRVRRERRATT